MGERIKIYLRNASLGLREAFALLFVQFQHGQEGLGGDLDGVRRVIVNPTLELVGSEMMELMDDCLCFPGLLVKVQRNRRCIVRYRDENWQVQELQCEGYLSELIQHEYDHLNGVLATMRAVDGKAFVMKK